MMIADREMAKCRFTVCSSFRELQLDFSKSAFWQDSGRRAKKVKKVMDF